MVFIPCKGGQAFISCHPDPRMIYNADLNASFNIGVKAFIDPNWQGSVTNILVDADGVPDKQRYNGSLAIPAGQPLAADFLKGEKSEKAKSAKKRQRKPLYYLWRPPSCAPIDSSSTWFRTWDFFDMIKSRATKRLMDINRACIRRACGSRAGFDP
jgi:hypothetical protein